MPPAPRAKKPTLADLASELEEVKARLAALESRSEPAAPAIEDLTGAPVVLVMIDRNTVEVVHSNVPGLKVVVHDADVLKNPGMVEPADKNKTGVMSIEPAGFDEVGKGVRDKVRELAKVELPK